MFLLFFRCSVRRRKSYWTLYFLLTSTTVNSVFSTTIPKNHLDTFWEDIKVDESPPISPKFKSVKENFEKRRVLEPYSLNLFRSSREIRNSPLQFNSNSVGDSGANILNKVAEYGINETRFLIQVQEPKIFKDGR